MYPFSIYNLIAKILAQKTCFLFGLPEIRRRQSMDNPLKVGKAKAIRFSTPEEICKMPNCQPGDILEYMNDEDYEKLIGR